MKVRIMTGGLSNRIFAVKHYSERPNGLLVAAMGGKDDVTEEAIRAVAEHRLECKDEQCRCGWSTADWMDHANLSA
jgi:hypothetical protein